MPEARKRNVVDIAHRRAQRERERVRQERIRSFRRDAAPILADLRNAGLPTSAFGSFGRLVDQSGFDDRQSVPILLKWLPRAENPDVKESIVRHLSTRYARPIAAPPLLQEFRETPTSQRALKWAIGNALWVVADKRFLQDLLDLAADPSHGEGRRMIVDKLGYFKDPRIPPVLLSILDDESVSLNAMSAIRRQLGPEEARPHIEKRLKSSSELIRGHAREELKKIDRRLAKLARRPSPKIQEVEGLER